MKDGRGQEHSSRPYESGPKGQGSLTRKTVAGLQWTYAQTLFRAFVILGVGAVLARLLSPTAFGLIALARLALQLINYFARGGIHQALVQRADLTVLHIRAAFVDSLLLGLLFGSMVWLAAPMLGGFFDSPELPAVLRWMALALPIFSLGAVAEALLRRQLRFRALVLRDMSSYLLGYAGVSLSLATLGFGVWALVAGTLSQLALEALLAYVAVRHSVIPTANKGAHSDVLGFGSRVSIISFFEFLGSELDTFAVGRFEGPGPLGLYNRAYTLMRLPLYNLSSALSQVLFPAFSSVQNERHRLSSAYLSVSRVASSLVFPVAVGMAVSARELILVLLGGQWTAAIPVVPPLAAAGALNMLSHFAGVTAEATARLNPKIAISIGRVIVLASLLLLFRGWGLVWYGVALASSELCLVVVYTVFMSRTLEVPIRAIVRAYVPGLGAALTVGAAIGGVRLVALGLGAADAVVLVLAVIAGAVVLWIHLRLGFLRSVRDDVLVRLSRSGMLTGSSARLQRLLHVVLGRA